MGSRQGWARRCTYWLEPKNWLIVTVMVIGAAAAVLAYAGLALWSGPGALTAR